GGLAGVGDDAHAAEVSHVHRRHDDGAAMLGRGIGDGLDVVGGQVDRPHVGPALALVAHGAGHAEAVLLEVDVVPELLAGVFRGPTEELAVERAALVGVGREEVDPARGTHWGCVTLWHCSLLPHRNLRSSVDPWTTHRLRTHRLTE